MMGTVPSAGTLNVSGISKTRSGVPIDQPCGIWAALVPRRGRRAGCLFDPGEQERAIALRQTAVVGEMAVARIGVPGGHAADRR